VEIYVARYQAQKKYWLQQIAWKFWLRVIKHRKNIGLDKIAWKFRLHVIKRGKNYGFNKIAWKFCGAYCSTSLHRFDNAAP
jgi:hypothetical protein